jgi:hypothetical protein
MSRDMLETPVLLWGQGIVVEMDESTFGAKRKYNWEKVPPDTHWVFRAIDTHKNKVALFQVQTGPNMEE